MKEIWKPVRNYEGLYEVSNYGRVRSLERTVWYNGGYYKKSERILKLATNKSGYLYVTLSKDTKKKNCRVHRLVANAFLENPDNLPEVNHKDENKQNNCVENLEWCSHSYNNRYNDKAKKVGKKNSKPIYSINKESGLITYWESIKEASRQLSISQGNIWSCCIGKRKSAGGFYWQYSDSEEVM